MATQRLPDGLTGRQAAVVPASEVPCDQVAGAVVHRVGHVGATRDRLRREIEQRGVGGAGNAAPPDQVSELEGVEVKDGDVVVDVKSRRSPSS